MGTELTRFEVAKSLYTMTKSKFLIARLTRSKWMSSISFIEVTKKGASYSETKLEDVGNMLTLALLWHAVNMSSV